MMISSLLKNTKLAHTWPWNKEWVAFTFWLPCLSGLALMYLSQNHYGNHAYWFLAISAWGILFSALYAFIGNKVSRQCQKLEAQGLLPVDGLVSFGKFQAPSAIALTKDKLYLAPIVGSTMVLSLTKLTGATLSSAMPGKKFAFKRAFHLTFNNDTHVSFAVSATLADTMKPIFESYM